MTKRLALILGLSLFLLPAAALADSFDFNATGSTDSSWSWGGGTSSLTADAGKGITLVPLDFNNQPLTTAVQLIVNGTNMTTGYCGGDPGVGCSFMEGSQFTFTTGNATNWNGSMATFGSGGTITVGNDIWGDCSGGYCFSGTFTGAQLLFAAGGNTATFVGNFVSGTLSQDLITLLAEFGAPINPNDPTSVTGSLSLTLNNPSGLTADGGSCGPVGGTPTQVPCFHSGDLVVTPVPEPGTLTLLGTGLLSLAGALRRKMKKA